MLIDEGFRNLNQENEGLINKSEAVNKTKKEANGKELSANEEHELNQEEKNSGKASPFRCLQKRFNERCCLQF